MAATAFGHDIDCGLGAAIDLVNTAPETGGAELLDDVDALRGFLSEHRFETVGEITPDHLPAVRAVRSRLLAVLGTEDFDEAVRLVNALITDTGTTPRLARHDGHPWHMHYYAPGAAPSDHIGAECAMSLAFAFAADGRDRFRECASPGCRRLLVDLSRNRCKRFCDSRTCGNRAHVAAYRARRRAAS
ncbi:CGNR zinc finger domain-containing protein [Pseudonocardia acaciae]|uniref:CGNR zinc finger domain-containing protein n=1 Tax=Pseudonocardia acaciae TaxID=551276 RepID=UPI00056D3E3C|nr:CGNR zinc finger domain-containing protein [Pseudonocardia acaciae]